MKKQKKSKKTFLRIIILMFIAAIVFIMAALIMRGTNRKRLIGKIKEGEIFSTLSEQEENIQNQKDKIDSKKEQKSSEQKMPDGISLLTSDEVEKILEDAGGLDEGKKTQENTYVSDWKITGGEDMLELFSCLEQNIEIKSVSEEKKNQIIVTAKVPDLGTWLINYAENTVSSVNEQGMEEQILSDIESGICKKKEQQIIILLEPAGLNWKMKLTEEGIDGLTGGFLTAIDDLTEKWNEEWNAQAESGEEK